MATTEDDAPEFAAELAAQEPELVAPLGQLTELLEPASVPAGSLERLMIEVSQAPLRYAPFFERLAELWDLPESDVRGLLERARDKRNFRKAPLPGLELMAVHGGPRIAGADAFLASFAAGMTFP